MFSQSLKISDTRQLDFGKSLVDSGWVIVVMNIAHADSMSLNTTDKSLIWLKETCSADYVRVSYRRIAFKNADIAVLFKLMFC